VDGLHLFNYYSMPQSWRSTVLADMADPARLALADKRIRVDAGSRERPTSTLGFSFKNAVPRAPLPVDLQPTDAGLGATLALTVADTIGRSVKVRKTPGWPRSWANSRLLQLDSHAWANLHIMGQPDTALAEERGRGLRRPRDRRRRAGAAPQVGINPTATSEKQLLTRVGDLV
jgi:hypothetical protein